MILWLGASIGDSGPSQFVQMMTLGWPCPILQQGQICSLMLLYGKKLLESHLMEETYSKWPEWQNVYVKLKILTPGAVCPCPGAIYMYKRQKYVWNQTSKLFFFKLATNGQSDKAFLSTSEFRTERVVCPCPRAIYMWKTLKLCIKSEFTEIFF